MIKRLLICLAAIVFLASGYADPGADYDFYICARIDPSLLPDPTVEAFSGVLRYDEDGSWQPVGVNDLTISGFDFDPAHPEFLCATALNGLWISRDGGVSWRMANDWTMTEGRDVALDRNTPGHTYVALPDGIAALRDPKKDLIRRETGLPARGKYTETIEVDRTTGGRVLAGTASGIYLTENHGALWTSVLSTETTVNGIQQSPHDALTWMAVTDSEGGFVSRDGGRTWEPIPTLPADSALHSVSFDPTDPKRIAIGGWSCGVRVSEDGGTTWLQRNDGLPPPHRVMQVGINPNTGRLHASLFDETPWCSDDFGRTWRQDGPAGAQISKFVTIPHHVR